MRRPLDDVATAHLSALRAGFVDAAAAVLTRRMMSGALARDRVEVAALMGDRASQRVLGMPEVEADLSTLAKALSGRFFIEVKARVLIAMARLRLAGWYAERDAALGGGPGTARPIAQSGNIRISTNDDGWVTCEWFSEEGVTGSLTTGGAKEPLTLERLCGPDVPSRVIWAAEKCVMCPCALHAAACISLDDFASGWRSRWRAFTPPCLAAAELVPRENRLFTRWDHHALSLDGGDPPPDELEQASHELTLWALELGDPVAEDVERLERRG